MSTEDYGEPTGQERCRCGHNAWTDHGGIMAPPSGCDRCACTLNEEQAATGAQPTYATKRPDTTTAPPAYEDQGVDMAEQITAARPRAHRAPEENPMTLPALDGSRAATDARLAAFIADHDAETAVNPLRDLVDDIDKAMSEGPTKKQLEEVVMRVRTELVSLSDYE